MSPDPSVVKTIVQSKPSRATFLKAMQAKFHKLDTDHDNLLTWGLPGAPETLGAVADC